MLLDSRAKSAMLVWLCNAWVVEPERAMDSKVETAAVVHPFLIFALGLTVALLCTMSGGTLKMISLGRLFFLPFFGGLLAESSVALASLSERLSVSCVVDVAGRVPTLTSLPGALPSM